MKTKIFKWLTLPLLLVVVVELASCREKDTVKVLKNEPVYVRKGCFEHIGRVDAFYFELKNENTYSEIMPTPILFPVGEIPEQYRQEGLSVKISGYITDSIVTGGCIEPDIRLAYVHLFELKSMKFGK